jgi:hypothetical protein
VLPVWRCVQASKKEETFSEQLRVLTAKCKEVSRVFVCLPAASFSDTGSFFPTVFGFFLPGSNILKKKVNNKFLVFPLFVAVNFTKFKIISFLTCTEKD